MSENQNDVHILESEEEEEEDVKPDINILVTITNSPLDLEGNTSKRTLETVHSLVSSKQRAPELHQSWNLTETPEISSDEEWPESVPSKANSVCNDVTVAHHHMPRCRNRNPFPESYLLNKHIINPGDSEGIWEHDLYDDVEQTPKSDKQIISEYGRNIRKYKNPASPRRK